MTDKLQKAYETAARYQMYHSIVLLCCGFLQYQNTAKCFTYAAKLFVWGMVLFCGSLYLLVIFHLLQITNLNFIGAITPLGGACLIAGWVCLAMGARKLSNP